MTEPEGVAGGDNGAQLRAHIADADRIVIKIGSSSLTGESGGSLQTSRLVELVDHIAALRLRGSEVVVVSSGAIAAGLTPLGMRQRPTELAAQQAAASVGQGALIAAYAAAFGKHDLTVSQVLLTADDLTRRRHYVNAQRALRTLLSLGVVPIVNENDTVATDEIRFGDNDRLAALVAQLIEARALVLLTDVDGLYDRPPSQPGATRLAVVMEPATLDQVRIGGSGSRVGSGGMTTKVEAAGIAGSAGIPTMLASSAAAGAALSGQDVGTVFAPVPQRPPSRRLWIAHATAVKGRVVIDAGAVRALLERRSSLLAAGISSVEGIFAVGDPIEVATEGGQVLARGLVNFSSSELPVMLGRTTGDLARDLGVEYQREVIHRDDLVIL